MSRRTSRPPLTPSLPYHPFHSSALPSLSLEVGPLNTARGLGSSVRAPAGSGAEPQPKPNLVNFILEIRHLVAAVLMIFLRINWPHFVQFEVWTVKANWDQNFSPPGCLGPSSCVIHFAMDFAWFCNFALDQMCIKDPLIPSQIRNHLVSPDSNSPACMIWLWKLTSRSTNIECRI